MTNAPTLLAAHDIDVNDPMFDKSDVISHLMNGYCANHSTPACVEISRKVKSPVKMAIAVTKIVIDGYSRGELSPRDLQETCSAIGIKPHQHHPEGPDLINKLKMRCKDLQPLLNRMELEDIFETIEKVGKRSLQQLAIQHQVDLHESRAQNVNDIRTQLVDHISSGSCQASGSGSCVSLRDDYRNTASSDFETRVLRFASEKGNVTKTTLKRILERRQIQFSKSDGVNQLRNLLRSHVKDLRKGKKSELSRNLRSQERHEHDEKLEGIRLNWPQPASMEFKEECIRKFRAVTSSESLRQFTCACCAESVNASERKVTPIRDVNLDLMRDRTNRVFDTKQCTPPGLPFSDGPLAGVLVDPGGVICVDGNLSFQLCHRCISSLSKNKLPRLAIANLNVLGPVPPGLKAVTMVEEMLIARCRAKQCIVKLQDHRSDISLPSSQRGFKGHVIVYPQRVEELSNVLPPPVDEVVHPMCVMFIGSTLPSQSWLKDKAYPLVVRREVVRENLIWLKAHNPLYRDIVINEERLQELPADGLLSYKIEHIQPTDDAYELGSRYDTNPSPEATGTASASDETSSIQFSNVVITDIEANASPKDLKAAALRHYKRGGSFLAVPHEPIPVNEFFNPTMLPMMYPTLFPYGIGGVEDKRRTNTISFENHVRHFLSLADRRFQEHYSFMFTAFNIIQRRKMLLHTSLKVKRSNFRSWADKFKNVSSDAIERVISRSSNGSYATAHDEEERKVLDLMKDVNTISSHVPGSSASRVAMRNEIRALTTKIGLPSFFITINPADIYNPIVKFLAGEDIDIDSLLPEQVPNSWEQSILIAKNPVIAAQFFDTVVKAFFSTLLGYDPTQKDLTGGVLGLVKGYYGCVEAQGRGTLHCHMLVWLEGALNPNEIRDRVLKNGDSQWGQQLIRYLDDAITNIVPDDPDPQLTIPSSTHHPCSVRGVDLNEPNLGFRLKSRLKDLFNVVRECQIHSHTKTCYKNRKVGEDLHCRFDHDEDNFRETTDFDPETAEICLRCLHGMVNNFNATIIEAIRCNMDIKFIGSGESAKAILYYITDYITKTDLKTHVAFSALKLAVEKLGEYDPAADEVTIRAKRMLQKCAYAMLSHQELSAQQVASWLVGGGDHYTSHSFRNLYWTAFEASVNAENPSPECYKTRSPASTKQMDDFMDMDVQDKNLEGDELRVQRENSPCDGLGSKTEEDSSDSDDGDDDDNDNSGQGTGSDDVHISFSRTGCVFERSSQVEDYQFRAERLNDMSVWDFVSTVDQRTKLVNRTDQDFDEELNEEDKDEMSHGPYELQTEHRDYGRKVQYVCAHFWKHLVPVPIGPALPRRDRPEMYPKYARLMLILFKPWRTEADLRGDAKDWSEAFSRFAETCTPEIRGILNNMQLLHECKDSSQSLRKKRNQTIDKERRAAHNNNTESDMDEIMDHIDSVENYYSRANAESHANVNDCLWELQAAGMFSQSEHDNIEPAQGVERIMLPDDDSLEDQWKTTYENRRNEWKKKLGNANVDAQPIGSTEHTQSMTVMTAANASPVTVQHQVMRVSTPPPDTPDLLIADIINKWSLNTEQARAFTIVALHSTDRKSKPLRMYIGGPGGTGKSRVIHALTEWFERRKEPRRLRLTSYTGAAAKNISGTTLHTALCLNPASKKTAGTKTRADLVAMWDGVDHLLIDEVSMIGCHMMVDIHNALVNATGCTEPFGGINVIFAGDFAQLPPVGDTKLYTHLSHAQLYSNTPFGQKTVFGKLLWRSVDTVVLLDEQMRQTGEANAKFISLLSRLRDGSCSETDFELLNTRLISTANEDLTDELWRKAPVIVSENAVKDAINVRATLAFAERTHQTVQWFEAIDTYYGKKISDMDVREYMLAQPSGKTGQRLGKFPLVLGMPVVVNQNFDVSSGLVNGSFGYLREFRFQEDEKGVRSLKSCVVEVPGINCNPLPHLPPNHVAVISDTVDMRPIINPASGKSCKMRRFQVPLTPGFAVTAHKAQGLSLSHVIIDLTSCKGTESPYVMASRATSLDGLLIMRPFSMSKISCHRSQEARDEFDRLNLARWQAIAIHGTLQERLSAQKHLASQENHEPRQVSQFFLDGSSSDPNKVTRIVMQLQNDNDHAGQTKQGIDKPSIWFSSHTNCQKVQLESANGDAMTLRHLAPQSESVDEHINESQVRLDRPFPYHQLSTSLGILINSSLVTHGTPELSSTQGTRPYIRSSWEQTGRRSARFGSHRSHHYFFSPERAMGCRQFHHTVLFTRSRL